MKHLSVNLKPPVLLALALLAMNARADDGVVRLRAVEGPFLVTIFTAPELQQGSPVAVNVLVQERDSSDAILDAELSLTFSPPGVSMLASNDPTCGAMGMSGLETNPEPFAVAATHRLASNKLFYAAPVNLDAAGEWRMQVAIRHEGASVTMACKLPVSPPAHELIGLAPCLCLPPLVVGLFVLNQRLRMRSREGVSSEIKTL